MNIGNVIVIVIGVLALVCLWAGYVLVFKDEFREVERENELERLARECRRHRSQ